jgi:hypothetical protein
MLYDEITAVVCPRLGVWHAASGTWQQIYNAASLVYPFVDLLIFVLDDQSRLARC